MCVCKRWMYGLLRTVNTTCPTASLYHSFNLRKDVTVIYLEEKHLCVSSLDFRMLTCMSGWNNFFCSEQDFYCIKDGRLSFDLNTALWTELKSIIKSIYWLHTGIFKSAQTQPCYPIGGLSIYSVTINQVCTYTPTHENAQLKKLWPRGEGQRKSK